MVVWGLPERDVSLVVELGGQRLGQRPLPAAEVRGAADDEGLAVGIDVSLLPLGPSLLEVKAFAANDPLPLARTTAIVTLARPKKGPATVALDRRRGRGLRVGEPGSELPLVPFGAYIYNLDDDGNRAFPSVEAPQGLNLVAPYISKTTNHTEQEWATIMAFLDNCSAVGMRVHYHINTLAVAPDTPDKWSVLETEITRVRDHPAILAYYIAVRHKQKRRFNPSDNTDTVAGTT